MRQITTDKNGQQYDNLHHMPVHYCRTCGLKMFNDNKGFDYRCGKCHEKAEGWC